jgi:hypothetical protein
MHISKRYWSCARTSLIVLVSAASLLLAHYIRTFTEHNLFTVLFPAVAVSSWLGGRLGGLLSTGLLALCTAYFFLRPVGFAVEDLDDVVRLGTFALSGAFVAWLSGALKESQGLVSATLESIGDAVIATDRSGKVRLLNRTAEALTGWSHKEAKGRPLVDVFRTVQSDTGEAIPLAITSPEPNRTGFPDGVALISKSGEQIPIDDSLCPVRVDSGRVRGWVLVFRDATRRKQSEAAALESERRRLRSQRLEAIGRLAGGVAHDFNNLLTIINGYADHLVKQVQAGSSARNSAEEILRAGERAAGLTRQLLLFSRGQPAKLHIADLNQVVGNFEKMLRRLIGEDIYVQVNLANQPLPVMADVGQIEQVIMNLTTNARDAMPHGGRLVFQTGFSSLAQGSDTLGPQARDVYAELVVEDTGIGMDQETLIHLFEPFFTTKSVHRGTGLGLSLTYGIIKSHNGHLKVESRPGKGTIFRIYLPLAKSSSEQFAAPVFSVEPPAEQATILLVEDDDEVRRLMKQILTDSGHAVLEAAGVDEAIGVAEEHGGGIDLLVSDIVMPGFNGIELATRLAAKRPKMSVLYVSGYSDQEVVLRGQQPSVNYLQKPFAPSELVSRVAQVLARSRQAESG